MSNEIARRETPSLPEKMDWVRALASSTLLPRQYQNNPGNLLFAIEYADALGVDRMAAITSIHVIEGKPSASADLIANLVRKAGHRLRVSGDDQHAVAQIIRADDPDFTYEARWDLAKARAAGLLGKGVWKNYPGAMLRSRAITEVARMGASDALFGVIYTPEELGVETTADGTVVHRVTQVEQQPTETGADRMRQIVGTPQTSGAEGSRAETPVAGGEAGSSPAGNPSAPLGITPAQVKKLAVTMGFLGLSDRESALGYVATVIGRTVESRNDLTKDEASVVIDRLEADMAAAGGDDVVDGEIVDDPEAAEADDLWAQIVAVAGQLGWEPDRTPTDFKERMGCIPDDADLDQLRGYLELITAEVAA